jgi:hypothetical protein
MLPGMSARAPLYHGWKVVAGIGPAFERFGPRVVVMGGMTAMGAAALSLTLVTQAWQLYVVFPVMAVGWAAMSGAALNLIIAPWFAVHARRRGARIVRTNESGLLLLLRAPAVRRGW